MEKKKPSRKSIPLEDRIPYFRHYLGISFGMTSGKPLRSFTRHFCCRVADARCRRCSDRVSRCVPVRRKFDDNIAYIYFTKNFRNVLKIWITRQASKILGRYFNTFFFPLRYSLLGKQKRKRCALWSTTLILFIWEHNAVARWWFSMMRKRRVGAIRWKCTFLQRLCAPMRPIINC